MSIESKGKSFLKFNNSVIFPNKAGICAIINEAINICQYHVNKFDNHDVYITSTELSDLFDFKTKHHKSLYKWDIRSDYVNSNIQNPSNAHTVFEPTLIHEKRLIFDALFFLKDIDKMILDTNTFVKDKTLGVHLRGTDKAGEVKSVDTLKLFTKIDFLISEKKINSIFLATDDERYLSLLSERYPELVLFDHNKTISKNGKPIHFKKNRRRINREVIQDCFILSRCPYFIYSFSNVSYLALIMGVGKFEEVYCANTL
jgi:hypothetical protein